MYDATDADEHLLPEIRFCLGYELWTFILIGVTKLAVYIDLMYGIEIGSIGFHSRTRGPTAGYLERSGEFAGATSPLHTSKIELLLHEFALAKKESLALRDGLRLLNNQDRSLLLARATAQHFSAESRVLTEGHRSDELFLLRMGRMRVEVNHMGGEILIAFLEPGEIFGELSFLDGSPASTSVIAHEPSDVAIIPGRDLRALAESNAGFAHRFYESLAIELAERLRDRTPMLIPPHSWG